MKKIFIWGWYGNANPGDEAILISMLSAIKKGIRNVDIIVASDNPQLTARQYRIKTFYRQKIISLRTFLKHPLSYIRDLLNLLRRMREIDLFILGGGGLLKDFGSDLSGRGSRNIIRWLEPVALAKLCRKPVMFYGIGVGPINTRLGKFLTRLIANKVDLITVRDEMSKQTLETLGVSKPPIYVTVDPAITLSAVNAEQLLDILNREGLNKNQPLIGLCLTSVWHDPKTWPGQYSKFLRFKEVIAQLADYLASELGAKIVFIPFWSLSSIPPYKRDRNMAVEIARMMRHKNKSIVLSGEYTPEELMGIIERMDLVIGMRLHSLIFAAAMNVPAIGISHQPKHRGFLQILGQETLICNIENINENDLQSVLLKDLKHKAREAWAARGQIKKDLKFKVKFLRKLALLNAELALKLI